MAEDRDFGYEDDRLDYNLDHDHDDEQEVDTTRPFQPGAASNSISWRRATSDANHDARAERFARYLV